MFWQLAVPGYIPILYNGGLAEKDVEEANEAEGRSRRRRRRRETGDGRIEGIRRAEGNQNMRSESH